jgi:uncharacterized protein (DUF305 family)
MKRDHCGVSVGARIKYALLAALFGIAAFLTASCGGARGEVSADRPEEAQSVEAAAPGYVPADAQFVRDMIVHHRQALDMTALAPDRTSSDDMRLLARRIEETQVFEIDLMRRWLEERDEPAPVSEEPGAHGGHHPQAGDHSGMGGMASPEQMAALAESDDAAFDRMFLELMIRHHDGALIMVDDLLATEGGGKEPALFMMLSHIDADQRAEIARMQRMLDSLD